MMLWLPAAAPSPEQTPAYETTANVPLQYFDRGDFEMRVVPGDPERSALVFRMRERGTRTQMPTIATELVHEAGVELVEDWIRGL